ncbi:MAG TPA: iron uptake system protein EfeO [Solirubrobacteraceae bacterium]|nr:iron uptake system protein EfeO [Solirubrobacteraceae bacterium]
MAGLGLTACAGSDPGGGSSLRFTLTNLGCTPGEASVPAGPVTISVTNGGDPKVTELEVQNLSGIVLGERENLFPGLSGTFSLDLEPGRYILNCPDGDVTQGHLTVTGKPFKVHGPAQGLLRTAVLQYRTYVEGQTGQLLEGTRRFVAAIEQGDMAEAKLLYGPTRIHYEAIEPVAESFAGLDSAIDARIDSPTVDGDYAKWTGFHRIEYLMWDRHTLRGATHFADLLLADVQELDQRTPTLPLSALQLVNGSVGLLNEIVNTKITGEEDRYSHTDLSDFQGNLTGARRAFEYVRPAMERIGETSLAATIAREFQAVQVELNRYRRDTPLGFALYGALTQTDKVAIARQIGDAAQSLSGVALKLALTH